MMDDATSPLLGDSGDHVNEPKYYSAVNNLPPSVNSENSNSIEYHAIYSSGQSTDEDDPKGTQTVVYTRRWYILLLFGILAFTQGGLWNTWSPISTSSQYAFGFTNIDIFMLPIWGPIAYSISMFPLAWITDTKGLRSSCLLCAFLVTLGTGLRCITSNPSYARWLIHAGQFLLNLAGPMAMGGAPALSAVWFPAGERIIATAIAYVFNTIGVGVTYVMGPLFVSEVKDWTNLNHTNSSQSFEMMEYFASNSSHDGLQKERDYIMKYMYVEFGWSAALFLLILIYFPSRPPSSPSVTASIVRVDFKKGAIQLMKNKQFWLIALSYGISLGAYGGWQGVLEPLLKPHNILQNAAGWLGFYAIVGACAGGFIVSLIAGVFSRHMKLILILLYTTGSASQLWFTLICEGYIEMPYSNVFLHVSIILGAFLINAAIPLYFETACEITYPVAEGVTNGVLTLVNNIAGCIFLFLLMIPGIGVDWVNWGVVGLTMSCIPALFILREKYNRLNIDEVVVTVDA